MRVVQELYLENKHACVSYRGRRCVRAALGCWCSQTCSLSGCVLGYFLSQVCSVCETLAEVRYQSLWTSAPSEPRRSNQTHQTHCSTEPEKADKNKNFKNTPIKETCTLIHTLTVTFGGSGGGNPCLRVELRRRKQSEKEYNYLIGLCLWFILQFSQHIFFSMLILQNMIPYKQAPEEYKVFKIMFKV